MRSFFSRHVKRLPDEPVFDSDPPHAEGKATVFMLDDEQKAIVLCKVKRGGRWCSVIETYQGSSHAERVTALAAGGWEYVDPSAATEDLSQ
jgi:hypothetical protein